MLLIDYNKAKKVKACIFDLDGTLYNERDFVKSAFRAVERHISHKYSLNFEVVHDILTGDFENGLRGKNFDILLEKLHLSNEEVPNLVQIYRKHRPKICPFPDAESILKEFRGRFRLGLITDGWRETQENKISALNLKHYFDAIIINDIALNKHLKPSKKSFQLMMNKLKVKTFESIYIGDNPAKDFIGAKELGILTIRVRRGDGEYDSLDIDDEHEAQYTIRSLLNIREILVGYTA